MTCEADLTSTRLDLRIDSVDLDVAVARRDSDLPSVVFLHGFGSTKEDYLDFAHLPVPAGRGFLAYDAPGCGETTCTDLSAISVPFLVRTAEAVLERAGIERFHLVGHSMGGLTALLLAHRNADRVISFVDIEGNLAPEDCFLSRQILTHPADDAGTFVDAFVDRVRRSPQRSSALYATGVRHKVQPDAVRGIFASMVDLSDHGDLMKTFLTLPFPRMFLYGEQNASLSYLPQLSERGIELTEIPHSGHWPMYSNPVALWTRIGEFHARVLRPQESKHLRRDGAASIPR